MIITIAALLLLACVGLLVFLRANREQPPEVGHHAANSLNVKTGLPEPKLILDADEAAGGSTEKSAILPMDAILKQERGYEQHLDSMMRLIEAVCQEGQLDTLKEKAGYYYSTVPILYFDAVRNEVSQTAQVLIFSSDMACVSHITFSRLDDEIIVNCSACDIDCGEDFRANPDTPFIFVFNGPSSLLIDPENDLLLSPWFKGRGDEMTVAGDYYHALDYERLAVTYREVINNLVWVELD